MLNQLRTQMSNEVQALGGIDQALEACDRMYRTEYRGDAMEIDFEDESLLDELVGGVKLSLYLASRELKEVPEFECERSAEFFWESVEDCAAYENVLEKIKLDPYYVEICNYKGEGEGIEVLATARKLPIFISKSVSFAQAQAR